MRTVLLGASGNFGARILRDLIADPRFTPIPATRKPSTTPSLQGLPTVPLDLSSPDFARALADLQPQLLIHCAGPFQGQDYRVARAALRAGAHYLDLADARRFVENFAAEVHPDALAANRLAISGASTLPALSFAVVEHLRDGMHALESVEIAIAPAQRARRGAATLAAVFSYLGRPFRHLHEGRWQTAWGWQYLRRIPTAIGTRWAAACDVPDLGLLPRTYPTLRQASFHAALEIGFQHFFLWTLACVRRAGLALPAERWAARLDRLARSFDRFGGENGAMWVRVRGKSARGEAIERTWHLVAPGEDGPEIPCMAATLLARQIACGSLKGCGARACTDLLALDDFALEFQRWGIRTCTQP